MTQLDSTRLCCLPLLILVHFLYLCSERGKNEYEAIEAWLYALTNGVEHHAEAEESLRLLEFFLDEPERKEHLTESVVQEIKSFVTTKFSTRMDMLSGAVYHHLRCFDKRTTSHVESENSRIKTSVIGTRANQSIDLSAGKMNHLHHQSLIRKEISEVAAADQTFTSEELQDRSVAGLVANASTILWEEHDRSRHLTAFEISLVDFQDESKDWTRLAKLLFPSYHEWLEGGARVDRVFLVVPPDRDRTDPDWHNPTHINFQKTVIPRFIRTRMVILLADQDGLVAVCSCARFSRSNLCCSHIYCVQGSRKPETTDASHRFLTLFGLQYGRCEAATKAYHQMQDGPLVGPPCSNPMSVRANTGTTLRRSHVEPLCRPTLRLTNSYWDRDPTRLEKVMAGSKPTWDAAPPFNFNYLPGAKKSGDWTRPDSMNGDDDMEMPAGDSARLDSSELFPDNDDWEISGGDGGWSDSLGDHSPGSQSITSPGSQPRSQLEQIRESQQNAYMWSRQLFNDVCEKAGDSPRRIAHVMKRLHEIDSELMAMRSDSMPVSGTASLPATDRQRGVTRRMRPATSPLRKRTRTRKTTPGPIIHGASPAATVCKSRGQPKADNNDSSYESDNGEAYNVVTQQV